MPHRNKLFFLLFICIVLNSFSQTTQKQEVELDGVKNVQLNLDEVFALEIVTGDFSSIRFISEAEGEYVEELQLEIKRIEETLYVNSLFEAILASGFDKLSSHKVFSFRLKICIPIHLLVYLKSNIAKVQMEGKLAYFEADLKNGDCQLLKHEGDVKINTYRGNIEIQTQDAEVIAQTRSGQLQYEEASYQKYRLELKSIEGDIQVNQLN